MKSIFIKLILTLAVLTITVTAGLVLYGFNQFNKLSGNNDARFIVIEKGMGTFQIATLLSNQSIIDDPYVFTMASKIISPDVSLKAGEYEFKPQTRMEDTILKLKRGDVYKRFVTIPEGLTSFEIIERLKSTPDVVWQETPIPPEGSLLPDTYQIKKGESVTSLITRMQAARDQVLEEAWNTRMPDLPISSKEEAVILASLIEKETGVPSERQRIAGVFINRLRLGMPLQTDPTVIYAITKGQHQNDGKGPLGRRLLLKDLQIDSPYNTYKVIGLPPTPIANAGRDSIKAALNPESHDYIFFVADGTGGHAFAKTLSEHNQNVAKWRAIRKTEENSEKD